MEGLRTHPPTVLFRAATLIGCFALLLGVAGVFYFGSRDGSRRGALPADASTVFLRGIEASPKLRIEVSWRTSEGEHESEDGVRSLEEGLWHFRKAPEGTPLTLRVFRREGSGRRMLHEQYAIFTHGAAFEVLVRAD